MSKKPRKVQYLILRRNGYYWYQKQGSPIDAKTDVIGSCPTEKDASDIVNACRGNCYQDPND